MTLQPRRGEGGDAAAVGRQGPVAEPVGAPRLKANVIGPLGLAALVIGVTSPAIGLSSLWSAPFRTGGSVVVVCLLLFALQLLAATWVRLFRPDLLATPIGVGPAEPG